MVERILRLWDPVGREKNAEQLLFGKEGKGSSRGDKEGIRVVERFKEHLLTTLCFPGFVITRLRRRQVLSAALLRILPFL